MISEEELVLVRQKADIVEIISDYISLTKKGKNYVCLCPFHNDKNHPSMVVSKEKQIFTCFSCKTGGNVFTFVSKYENVGFYEAVKIVASKVGINLKIKSSNYFVRDKNKNLFEIMNLSEKFYLNNINTKDGVKAKNYLANRGITSDVIKEFSLGVSLSGKNDLYSFLKSQNYSDEDIYNLGLINRSGIDIYDSFKNRIMIPITNLQNEVVGFTGRIYNGEDEAKYVNTKETIIFKKSEILFNYYNAKNYVRENKKIIIVEGNMDAIKLSSNNIKNVVALMGTFLSSEHVNVLKKLKVSVILMLDNDEAGYRATIKNGDILLNCGIICDVIRLTGAKDPDEYIASFGVDALNNNINAPINYLDFKILDLKKDKDMTSSKDLALFVKDLIELLKNVDELTKNVIVSKVCSEYNLDKNLFYTNAVVVEKKPVEFTDYKKTTKKSRYEKLSSKIFYYIVGDIKYLKIYKNELNFFKEKIERDLASEIDSFYKKNETAGLADFLTYISNNTVLNDMIMQIISECSDEIITENKFIEYIHQMKRKIKEEEIQDLKIQVKTELDVDKKLKLIERLTLIKGSVDYE